MNEEEFDVLDELYFVISYSELQNSLDLDPKTLKGVLKGLKEKEWLRVYSEIDEEVEDPDFENHAESYLYLASKKGLLAHNR